MTATFHEGEMALQESVGAREQLAQVGSLVIRGEMPQQHRDFFAQLPFLVAGTVSADGQPWASVLAGAPGFIQSPNARELHVNAVPVAGDPLAESLTVDAPVGLLGIQPHTRRRNRMNGHVTSRDAHGFSVHVDQSFGNCPKYIQARLPEYVDAPQRDVEAWRGDEPDEAARAMIRRADTFFIATAHPLALQSGSAAQGVDVSHRGGRPGFVKVEGSLLTVPDFLGNSFFNTLGNIAVNPRCGLLFIDFESGDLLYLAARAEILSEGAELESFEGAQRLLRMRVSSVRRLHGALPLRWSGGQLSPVLAYTGTW